MTVLRWTIRIHKWLALIIGLQIVIWMASGLVMSTLPIERVRAEHTIPAAAPPIEAGGLLPFEAVIEAAGGSVRTATLRRWTDRVVFHVVRPDDSQALIDAHTGAILTPIGREQAAAIARAGFAGDAPVSAVERFDGPNFEHRREGASWRVSFDDGEGTRLYILEENGMISARRNDVWRIFDVFWMLHIMDYRERTNFNHPLLIASAALALVTVLAGLVLLVLRLMRLARTRRRAAP